MRSQIHLQLWPLTVEATYSWGHLQLRPLTVVTTYSCYHLQLWPLTLNLLQLNSLTLHLWHLTPNPMIVGVLHCRVGYSLEETGEDGLYKVSFGVLKSRYLFFVGCAESWRSREIIGHFSKTLQGAGHEAVRDQVECDAFQERCVGAFWRWRGDWCFGQTTTASHTAVKWSPALWNWPTLGPAPHQEHSEGAGADGRPAMHPTQDFKICSDFQVSWLDFIFSVGYPCMLSKYCNFQCRYMYSVFNFQKCKQCLKSHKLDEPGR